MQEIASLSSVSCTGMDEIDGEGGSCDTSDTGESERASERVGVRDGGAGMAGLPNDDA
jgi:hypothetical protein